MGAYLTGPLAAACPTREVSPISRLRSIRFFGTIRHLSLLRTQQALVEVRVNLALELALTPVGRSAFARVELTRLR